jgi:hypothetical protein
MIGGHFAPRRDNLRFADAVCAGLFIWSSGIVLRRRFGSIRIDPTALPRLVHPATETPDNL